VGISGQHPLPAGFTSCERADQHEECGFWEVEIGEKAADNLEFVAWAEEDAGLAGMGCHRLAVGYLGAVFERSSRRSADCDDAISRLQRGVDSFGGRWRKGVVFGMKTYIFQPFCADGLESSQANVEGNGLDLHGVLFEFIEDFGRKVKAGSRGGGGTRFVGKDRLVAVTVFWAVVAVDVGRERHVPDFVEDSLEIGSWGKSQCAFAELSGREDFGLQDGVGFVGGVEEQVFAGLNFAAGPDEGTPVVFGKLLC